MNPEERANKVRASYEDAARRHPHNGDISALIPPGSIILTPDEARVVREALCPAYDLTEALDLLGGVS